MRGQTGNGALISIEQETAGAVSLNLRSFIAKILRRNYGVWGTQRRGIELQIVGLAEIADDRGDVALFTVDEVIQVAHVGPVNFAAQLGEYGAQLRELL